MTGITLILGSGAARGLCFIGAIRALEKAAIPIQEMITGSMGAVIGAAYCSGVPLADIEEKLLHVKLRKIIRPSLRGPGLFSSEGIRDLVTSIVPTSRFDQLRIPFAVSCTDIQSGRGVAFRTGNLLEPIVGSCLMPGLFDPIHHDGRLLVDGGLTAPIPIRYHNGVGPVVAVDPNMPTDWKLDLRTAGLVGSFKRPGRIWAQVIKSIDIFINELATAQLIHTDCIRVIPELEFMKFTDFRSGKFAIAAGAHAVEKALPLILSRTGSVQSNGSI